MFGKALKENLMGPDLEEKSSDEVLKNLEVYL